MIVRISTSLHARLIALAAADLAREVCGLLLGRDGRIEALVAARNMAEDPARTFEIDPRVIINAAKAVRGGGLPVIGCYHSHPNGVATPSVRDREMAEVGSVWLIVANGDARAWQRGERDFAPVELQVATD